MRPNIPTILQTDWFETSHADLRLAAVIGEAPKPKSRLIIELMKGLRRVKRSSDNGERHGNEEMRM